MLWFTLISILRQKASVPRLQQFFVGINATALQAGFVMISFEIIIYAFNFLKKWYHFEAMLRLTMSHQALKTWNAPSQTPPSLAHQTPARIIRQYWMCSSRQAVAIWHVPTYQNKSFCPFKRLTQSQLENHVDLPSLPCSRVIVRPANLARPQFL